MLTADQYARIRQLRRQGLTIRQVADRLNHSPKTVLKALANPEPVPAARAEPRQAPIFGPFREAVDAIVAEDEAAPRKQRHTASQVYRRLVAEHGYGGSYDQVRRHLRRRRLDDRETFIPLDHAPGRRADADFGHIHVDLPDARRLVPVLIVTWSHSNCPFAIAALFKNVVHGNARRAMPWVRPDRGHFADTSRGMAGARPPGVTQRLCRSNISSLVSPRGAGNPRAGRRAVTSLRKSAWVRDVRVA